MMKERAVARQPATEFASAGAPIVTQSSFERTFRLTNWLINLATPLAGPPNSKENYHLRNRRDGNVSAVI
jgi:hypothetical protein